MRFIISNTIKALVLAVAGSFILNNSFAQKIIRGPYLNIVTAESAVIRWRTDSPVYGKLIWGREGKRLRHKTEEKIAVTEHEIKVSGLIPGTKYYYRTGAPANNDSKTDSAQYFYTAPSTGSQRPVRIWALGDFGNGSKNQRDCFNAVLAVTHDRHPDAWIWLGDNAYDFGKDEEYQKNVFELYDQSFLQQTPIYPSPGNHDYRDQRENGAAEIAYYKIFTVPQHGEGGGIASGTASYYSVNYGNVHLVSLNSEEEINDVFTISDTLSEQVSWLKKDLEANRQTWTVIYLHRPPYTMAGSHNSDKEEDLVKLRKNLVPILERYQVDIVLAGHSHVYERTFPLLGHYDSSDTFDSVKHVVKANKDKKNRGIVYVVAGSGGQIDNEEKGVPLPAAAYYNNDIGGSVLLDFSVKRIDVKWICSDGKVRDRFFIEK